MPQERRGEAKRGEQVQEGVRGGAEWPAGARAGVADGDGKRDEVGWRRRRAPAAAASVRTHQASPMATQPTMKRRAKVESHQREVMLLA